jgi:hypothetical protein
VPLRSATRADRPIGRSADRSEREITVHSDPADRADTAPMLAVAAEVLRQHAPDADGWCGGCLTLWGRLAPHPCETAKWAAAVRAAYTDPAD